LCKFAQGSQFARLLKEADSPVMPPAEKGCGKKAYSAHFVSVAEAG